MKNVKLKTGVSTPSGVFVGGQVLTVTDPEATGLVNNGAAELYKGKAKADGVTPAAEELIKKQAAAKKSKAKGK